MKLSKKTRYGLHALIDLVIHAKTEQIALNSIAQRNSISEQYLEQVFSALRRARIVKSVKGAQGGYFLEKDPSDITVSEIVEILEGNYFLEDEAGGTEEGRRVIQELIVERVNKSLKEILEGITLQDLAEQFMEYRNYPQDMYYI
ncbi:Rrf2 family transcriptional regulator [Mediterraneibacter sp. NSJ-55]|uniref:Rrf2 family transcriptional regulator n=1 Tax=Mediterraneibacter hominis TaxID=2763054 RepID=A0A923RPF5_9FIRM|nr:Rrf2 family transcriptional regulator [Mediterraneibacter hominis]MBC5688381.1 Rrf2 family transcriptional regulator [Mediterraneibacter hominis]